MSLTTYAEDVRGRLRDGGFDRLDDVPAESRFDDVYGARKKSLKLGGVVFKFATIYTPESPTRDVVRSAAEDLRSIMNDESINVFGFGENMLGYTVIPMESVPSEVSRYITEDHDPWKGTSFSFPIAVDLGAGEVVHAPVPRLKQRAAYSTQKKDATNLFSP